MRCRRRGRPRSPPAAGRRVSSSSGPDTSRAARRSASPRRVNGGGSTASTSAPATTSWAPGSRTSTRSPGARGSPAPARVSRACRSPSGRTRTGAVAVPTCSTACVGSRCAIGCSSTSTTVVARAVPGVVSALPRGTSAGATARRFTASRVGPCADSTRGPVHLQPTHPHLRSRDVEHVVDAHRARGQGARDDRAGPGHGERPVDPEPHRRSRIRNGSRLRQREQGSADVVETGAVARRRQARSRAAGCRAARAAARHPRAWRARRRDRSSSPRRPPGRWPGRAPP